MNVNQDIYFQPDTPVTEGYEVVSKDGELQAISVIMEALRRHAKTEDAARRVTKYAFERCEYGGIGGIKP